MEKTLDAGASMKIRLDILFGSDEALGVLFIGDEDGRIYGPDDPVPEDAAVHSVLPDGASATCCTNYAIRVVRDLYPAPAQVVGFSNTENPQSRVAREKIHPGGHDFAVLAGRYLVDPWIRLVALAADQIVYDLVDPADAARVRDLYGPVECWTVNKTATEEAARAAKGSGRSQEPSKLKQGTAHNSASCDTNHERS